MGKRSTSFKLVFLAFFLMTLSAPLMAARMTTQTSTMAMDDLEKEVAEELALQVLMETARGSSNNLRRSCRIQNVPCVASNPGVCCSGECLHFPGIDYGICA